MERLKSAINLYVLLVVIMLFFEITFKAHVLFEEFGWANYFSFDSLRNILFVITYALFAMLLLRLFKPKGVRWAFAMVIVALSTLYISQDIYRQITNNFYSFAMSGDLAAGFTFFYRIPQVLSWVHGIYLAPFVLTIILIQMEARGKLSFFNIRYQSYKEPFIVVLSAMFLLYVSVLTIADDKGEDPFAFSDYDLYREPIVPTATMQKFGLITYTRIDLVHHLSTGGPNDSFSESDVDFWYDIHPGHEPNAMTGVLDLDENNLNVIMITAESLDTYAIHPELTPNLYRLIVGDDDHDSLNGSWYFNRFYAPLYYRNTADTEFMIQTGFYPNRTVHLSMLNYLDNTFPQSLPNLFNARDYTTLAFHNFSDHFYPRETFHPNTLGYDAYFSEERMGFVTPSSDERDATGHYWHSDLEMMKRALPYVLKEDNFFTYFLTVTGHLPYESGRHDYAQKHYPLIDDILTNIGREDIPEALKYYHAAHWEFDLALGYLLDALEAENQLDNTVIVVYGDHYAYGLSSDDIWDYEEYRSLENNDSFTHIKDDETNLNIHNVPFFIFHPTLTSFHEFDHLMSSVDVLPTLANMFGLDFIPEELMGGDAFSEEYKNTVIFSNVSFMTVDYRYEIEREVFISKTRQYTSQEIRSLLGEILFRNRINNFILEHDYFAEEDD